MSKTFSISFDLGKLEAMVDATAAQVEAAARPASQAGAQVIYDQVQRNVSRIKRKTGNLASSIYQTYSKERSRPGLAIYDISWNARKAPHGHLVEYGHLQRYEISFDPATKRFTTHKDRPLPQPKLIAARPFIRPAISKLPEAQDAMEAEFLRRINGAAK